MVNAPSASLGHQIRHRLARHAARKISDPALLPAAVVVPVVPTGTGPAVLLTRRTNQVEHHKREICFPGGRVDPADRDSEAAAVRETWEEVGIRPEHLTVLGALNDFVSVTGYRVRPFVGLLDRPDYRFSPAPREVEEILVIPAAHLVDPAHHEVVANGNGGAVHRFHWAGNVVWGLTAAILDHFLGLALAPGERP